MDLELLRLQETATQDSNTGLVPILCQIKLLQNTLNGQRNLGKAVFILFAKIQ
jgi:hypothetical protein